uniref:Uncharacterized protein n=1 Tax=Arundo donax TaxID=35708 RepID=A0A0A9GBN9_ARUDO
MPLSRMVSLESSKLMRLAKWSPRHCSTCKYNRKKLYEPVTNIAVYKYQSRILSQLFHNYSRMALGLSS